MSDEKPQRKPCTPKTRATKSAATGSATKKATPKKAVPKKVETQTPAAQTGAPESTPEEFSAPPLESQRVPLETARCVVILNPKSGSSGAEFRATIESGLQSRAVEYELRETQLDLSGGEIAAQEIAAGATLILACGGDGTVMSIVNGIARATQEQAEPAVTLSIIPGGTANLLATALKIPGDTDDAVAVAVAGEDRIIDLGKCGDDYFALGLGLGLTERLVSGTSARQKEKFGRAAYAWAMLRELGARPHNFTLTLDNKKPHRKSGVALVVANAGEIGGKMKFAPDARMDDGLLDVCVLRRFYFRDVIRMIIRTLFGDVRRDRAVAFYQARRIEIDSDPPLDLQIDGEEVDQRKPLIVEVVPQALQVRVPMNAKDEG